MNNCDSMSRDSKCRGIANVEGWQMSRDGIRGTVQGTVAIGTPMLSGALEGVLWWVGTRTSYLAGG